MPRIDLTHFGFTPTESLVYEVLLTSGPGTGYAIARAAGLARANAYSALEGLVAKGAARAEGGRPRQYRPEAPAGLIARIAHNHGLALDRLTTDLETIAVPSTPTVVEIDSGRAVLQLITHDVARASRSVGLLVPPDAFPLLAPALRRPVSAGLPVSLWSTGPVELGFAPVELVSGDHGWPGMPIIAVVDDRSAIVGFRQGNEVRGHWSTAPAFVAAARLALERFGAPNG
ncbi:MAG TPA: helix-turn-helix domain-containing protein [Gemmatimonadales bacterium]|nr:helix-turn-helix domain-containing protein [Gemmatimonadales bacterium]